VADITVKSSRLQGIEIGGETIPRVIDELPVIAVAATQAEGQTVVRDAAELRVKETDRIGATVAELTKLGANIEEREDGFDVEGPTTLRGGTCDSHGDHRIAMAVAVAGLVAEGPTTIENADCVDVSFPDFFKTLKQLAR
jgi:3-phosphoshikimate 1-carboxyvinyltransferase